MSSYAWDDPRRRLIIDHTPCLDRACRWPDADCTGGSESKRVPLEEDRDAIREMRKPLEFRSG